MMGLPSVRIYEVSPRDGLQNEAAVVPTAAKAELVRRLAGAGLPDVEVTSFVMMSRNPRTALTGVPSGARTVSGTP